LDPGLSGKTTLFKTIFYIIIYFFSVKLKKQTSSFGL